MSSGGASQRGQEKYKPSEHGGMKEDGTPDKRVKEYESEAHRANAEELAHGSHHASKIETEEREVGLSRCRRTQPRDRKAQAYRAR
ncbi:hypothetical protein M427DRAFT_477423 [Gonapodya prolifera JEL478]|uniref:Uncharacterized protein n=1 Tax=Gonapodya prolifera (strain JEL478) TaxID=1344416 RepID=A0A139A138_GONPJ|nr:hypothetical protein M427DRAFT_477423 [Gonapodya prolifera JEL478]|eukprot:KXS10496.1 hypothetical protein M427DRAFT_477423 [Gonapodya prolifera JEL478]